MTANIALARRAGDSTKVPAAVASRGTARCDPLTSSTKNDWAHPSDLAEALHSDTSLDVGLTGADLFASQSSQARRCERNRRNGLPNTASSEGEVDHLLEVGATRRTGRPTPADERIGRPKEGLERIAPAPAKPRAALGAPSGPYRS